MEGGGRGEGGRSCGTAPWSCEVRYSWTQRHKGSAPPPHDPEREVMDANVSGVSDLACGVSQHVLANGAVEQVGRGGARRGLQDAAHS